LIYLVANNLYGWAMSQPLSYGCFKWISRGELDSINITEIADDSEYGYIFEVDLKYPFKLRNKHNDLPFCCNNQLPAKSDKLQKLIADLRDKEKYIIHYKNLQQCIENGLILTKIHRGLPYFQQPWLKTYIDLNTFHRTNAKNTFEKDFLKLLNNF